MKSDVVIIGGGISGLATGALLAKQGKRVTVLEKGNVGGGRAYCYEEKGFTLNYGPHAMYTPESGVLAEVMARLERPVPECGYVDATRSYWQHHERFASMGSKPHQLMTSSLFSIGGRISVAKVMLALRSEKVEALAPDMTWQQWVESKTDDANIIEFMLALATVNTYTSPSGELSARWFLGHMQRSLFAKDFVGYMHGGWRSMYGAWVDDIEANGGAIVTGAAVDHVETGGGRITAAVTRDVRYEADAFVCTLPPQDAPGIAADGTALNSELQKWSSLGEVRAYCIDFGFNRILRDDLSFVFDVQQNLYYSIHSEAAPDLAPAGSQMMHAMAYLTAEEAADETARDTKRDQLIAGLDRYFPGWKEAAVVQRTMPNAKVVGARRTPKNIKNLVPLRSSTVGNLYFANDARDIDRNLSQVCLVAAMEVTDAIIAAPAQVIGKEKIVV